MKILRVVLVVLAAVLAPSLLLAASTQTRWYTFAIGEVTVGHLHEVTTATDEWIETDSRLEATLKRLNSSFDMRFRTLLRESEAGDLQYLLFEQTLSKQTSRIEVHIDGDRFRVASSSGQSAQVHERTIDRGPHRILGPAGVARLTAANLRTPGQVIEYSIFSPELQKIVRVRRVRQANDIIEETAEGAPAPRTLSVDGDGWMLTDSISGPFGAMVSRRSTREAALATSGGGSLPADLYERTVARSNIRLADAASVDRIVLRVRPRDPSIALPALAAHNQRVVAGGASAVVEIRRPAPPSGPVPRATSAEEFLAPNALIESRDTEIVKIARDVAGSENDAYRAAQALTRWVAEQMTFDSGIVMAPASELIRDRRATCMGYATLLASLARANGIPSRLAMGYVYYGGIWGGHAWTEMWIDGRWIPFDAAVYAPGIASATRLSVGTSSFHDGGGDLMTAISRLFARVDIDVLEIDGMPVRADTKPFRVERSRYVNAGLGLRIAAEGFAIERADSTWPSTLVVAFRRGASTIELHQKALFPQAPIVPRENTAVFASAEGATLWVWSAQGPDAAETLRRFLMRVEKKRPA